MPHDIVMVGDDGKVYRVKSSDLGRVAQEVPRDQLSEDAKKHLDETLGSGAGGAGTAVAHIFASKADIFTASQADIFASSTADIFTAASADIFVSGSGDD